VSLHSSECQSFSLLILLSVMVSLMNNGKPVITGATENARKDNARPDSRGGQRENIWD